MASKRRKLDHDNKHKKLQHEKERNAEVRESETLIYVVPKKIPKARLQVLSNLARKKEFPVAEHYRLVHSRIIVFSRKYHSFTHLLHCNNADCFSFTRLIELSDQQAYVFM